MRARRAGARPGMGLASRSWQPGARELFALSLAAKQGCWQRPATPRGGLHRAGAALRAILLTFDAAAGAQPGLGGNGLSGVVASHATTWASTVVCRCCVAGACGGPAPRPGTPALPPGLAASSMLRTVVGASNGTPCSWYRASMATAFWTTCIRDSCALSLLRAWVTTP